jgi:cell wall-associated NlpC family hydrolase
VSPAAANAKAIPDRVQGHASDLDELELRDGRGVAAEIGGALLPTPTLKRTIGGGSTIGLEVRDESLALLDLPLLSEDWEAQLDGLDFSYLGMKKAGTVFTIPLEESAIANLRELKGPKKVQARRGQPDEVTCAEFVISLIEEVKPRIPWHCPQLHEKQPIRTKAQGDAAKTDAKANRDHGIGDVDGLEVKGEKATKEQIDIGDRALRTAESYSAPNPVLLAVMEALIVESGLGAFSSNYMQIEPESVSGFDGNPNNIEEAVVGFLKGYEPTATGALAYYRAHPDAKPHEIAQAVQRSSAGDPSNGAGNYGTWEEEAQKWLDAFGGGDLGGEDTQAFYFEVDKDEDYWEAIKRLAKERNWRAFFVAGRFFFIDELELARGIVRLAITREPGEARPSTPGVEDVDFDYNRNKPITTATVYAWAKEWSVPPGGVITIAGYGPVSVGFGGPPPRHGQKAAISSNRKAATGEGRGRYLVESIEGALTGDAEARLLTIKVRKPTAPLGEPANETTSSSSGKGAGGNATAQRVLEFCEGEVGKPYEWGAFGPDSYDCSGFVSKALNVGGFLEGRLTTSGLASWGEAGEGEFITVHDKVGTGSARTEHVLIEVLGEIFECGGMSGGVGRPNYSADELAAFSTKRHPKGF